MTKIIFRLLERKDLREVFPLLQQLTKIDYSNRSKQECWEKFISNNSSNSVVGIQEDKVIAYGSILIENKIRGEAAGYIEDIVVDKKARSKKIGIRLVEKLINIANEKSCYRISLSCNENLIQFYNKNGFEVCENTMKLYPKK
jgi:GNAT superfamily N-acetyltransferase